MVSVGLLEMLELMALIKQNLYETSGIQRGKNNHGNTATRVPRTGKNTYKSIVLPLWSETVLRTAFTIFQH